jgi:phosphoserine phosphatase SerB
MLGKGASMRDGLMMATNEIVAFIDADIPTYPDELIDTLCTPLIAGEADFVKSYFERQAGRVTELVAKPLLSILFPRIAHFKQPLSGIVAAQKSWLQDVEFENDYGVDIGLLIDLHLKNARIAEVNIGTVLNKMKPWEQLGKMSKEVSRAILQRAQRMPAHNLETLQDINIVREQMEYAILESKKSLKKMIIFDMDNTILDGSFIRTAAKAFDFQAELMEIQVASHHPIIRTKKIARLLKGKSFADLLHVADSIAVTHDFGQTVQAFKEKGYITGIVSDSYDCITNHLKNKYGLDFSVANELEFNRSICTGEVRIPYHFLRDKHSISDHDYCKSNIMLALAREYQIDVKNIIAVGDGENDVYMLKLAGMGVSFCSTYEYLDLIADMVIKERSFSRLLEIS